MNLLDLHTWKFVRSKIQRDFQEDPIYSWQLPGITCDIFRQLIEDKIYESDSGKGISRTELDYFYEKNQRYFGDEHRKGVLKKL